MSFSAARLRHFLALFLVVAAVISAIATYITIAHNPSPLGPDPAKVSELMMLDLVLLLSLSSIIIWKIIHLWWVKRKEGEASKLHKRIIVMFSVVTIIPTIIITLFSSVFFNLSIQAWFDDNLSRALEESVEVAQGYLEEHRANIRADALAMANDLNRRAYLLRDNPARFKQELSNQAAIRTLMESIVFRGKDIVAKTDLSFSLLFEMEQLSAETLARANVGEVVILTNDRDDRVRALIKLTNYFDTYLLVGRFVDSKVLAHMRITEGSVHEHKRLQSNISELQLQFLIIFIAVSLLLLCASIWIGIHFANRLASPLSALIAATQEVTRGNLETRVDVELREKDSEVGGLQSAFNLMTTQLQKQQKTLIVANTQIEERRNFIENVLSGISAGVIALDEKQAITHINMSAAELLQCFHDETRLEVLFPEILPILNKAIKQNKHITRSELHVMRHHKSLTLLVQVIHCRMSRVSSLTEGFIITFDDISELVAAQRNAAWSDVARRIAHEIKNPLTPIHLSLDRLERKYSKEITSDPENFARYINTISRHLESIGRIVQEFSDFARLPAPTLDACDMVAVIEHSIFSEAPLHSDIAYQFEAPENALMAHVDEGQISQVLLNLLKNAAESLVDSDVKEKAIEVLIEDRDDMIMIAIHDNGPGFPENMISRITEPYVTTKEKGTGLGLAIVKKIITDHGGNFAIKNRLGRSGTIVGASVTAHLPKLV